MNPYFRDKKITLMGLGLLGRGVNDARFLAESGAELVVTDLKSEQELAPSLAALKPFPDIRYRLGRHDIADFQGRDLVVKAAGVPLDSPFVAEAHRNGIPVEMDESLFVKLAPPVTLVGVTGTRGKTTTTHLIYEMIKASGRRAHLGGNIPGIATLPLLDVVQPRDTVVLELSSWQLQGFGDARRSPHVAIVTNFLPDHLNYYHGSMDAYFGDKAQIFLHQTSHDPLIVGAGAADWIQRVCPRHARRMRIARPDDIPADWALRLPGEHNRANAALALAAADALDISRAVARSTLESFSGVEGRLEKIRVYNEREIYNDTTATTPDATMAGLQALSNHRNVVLIMGGSDKGLAMASLLKALPRYARAVILLAGSGTDRIRDAVRALPDIRVTDAATLGEAVTQALNVSEIGDRILFSPAFASFGIFVNEFDRGEQFNAIIKQLG